MIHMVKVFIGTRMEQILFFFVNTKATNTPFWPSDGTAPSVEHRSFENWERIVMEYFPWNTSQLEKLYFFLSKSYGVIYQ